MLNYKEKKLFVSESIRIIITIIILYYLNIPIFVKILLIMITDYIDCDIPRFLFGYNNWINCNEPLYQISDKIIDTMCYALLLFYLFINSKIDIKYIYFLILLFVYRLIGVYLFLIKNDRKYLFYFPNFFLETSLVIMIIEYFPVFKNFKIIIILTTFVYKIATEYYKHMKNNSKISNFIEIFFWVF